MPTPWPLSRRAAEPTATSRCDAGPAPPAQRCRPRSVIHSWRMAIAPRTGHYGTFPGCDHVQGLSARSRWSPWRSPPAPVPTASSTATPTTTAAPSSARTVPVDQIPPGRPTSWIPAGVPTTARYRQPGDVAPRFTLTMFTHNHTGALAVMKYYFDALNWDAATGATPSLYGLVCPSACYQEIRISKQQQTSHDHYAGGHVTFGRLEATCNPPRTRRGRTHHHRPSRYRHTSEKPQGGLGRSVQDDCHSWQTTSRRWVNGRHLSEEHSRIGTRCEVRRSALEDRRYLLCALRFVAPPDPPR